MNETPKNKKFAYTHQLGGVHELFGKFNLNIHALIRGIHTLGVSIKIPGTLIINKSYFK